VPATAATTRLGRVRAEALCAALRQAGIRPVTTKVEWLLPGGGRRAPALPSSPAAIAIG
jgi:hypothetical protein